MKTAVGAGTGNDTLASWLERELQRCRDHPFGNALTRRVVVAVVGGNGC